MLRNKLFTEFQESHAQVADMFLVERKTFYQAATGRTYDAGCKMTKAERADKLAWELEARRKILEGEPTKKEVKKTEPATNQPTKDTTPMDVDDMPLLTSDDEEVDSTGKKKKKFVSKKPTEKKSKEGKL